MIEIQELNVRLEGFSQEDAHWMGTEIAERIHRSLPPQMKETHMDELSVKVNAHQHMSRNEIADQITTQILVQLNNR